MTFQGNTVSDRLAFLAEGGEVAQLVARFDWSRTVLGPIEKWPEQLLTVINVIMNSPVGMVVMWGAEGTMIYNDGYARFAGDRHREQLGCAVLDSWPEARAFNQNVMNVVMAGGTLSYQDHELTLNRNGVPERLWVDLHYSPIIGADLRPAGVLSVIQETTVRVLARQRMVDDRQRLQNMFAQAPGFMAVLNGPDHRFELVNQSYLKLVGHRDPVGKTVREALPDVEGQGFIELLDQVYHSGEAVAGQAARIQLQANPQAAPEERFLDFVYQPLKDSTGATHGIFVEGYDVTERVRGEERLQVLMSEISHRLKNTLAVVQAVAAQTLRTARTLPEARVNLDARIVALARAQDVLRKESWHSASLCEVISVAIAAHVAPDGDRVISRGPDLELSPRAAVALSLALHELATNAAKYGALSSAGGHVNLNWSLQGDHLVLQWREIGGPAVEAPERRGFGSYLIEKIVAADLRAEVALEFPPEGLAFTLRAPLSAVCAEAFGTVS